MKSQVVKYIAGLGILASGLFFFQNCAPTNFQASQPTDIVNKGSCPPGATCSDPNNPGNPDPPGGTPTPLPPGATPTPNPNDPGNIYPKMTLETPVCQANTDCPVTFRLVKAYDRPLDFYWNTHDTKYTENPAYYGEPNRHYVPKNGYLNFAAGETSKVIYIRSLDILTNIRIPFQWRNCRFGTTYIDCKALQ